MPMARLSAPPLIEGAENSGPASTVLFIIPPLIDEPLASAVFRSPPLTEAVSALAVFVTPPLTEA